MSESEQLVKDYYAAFNAGDMDRFLSLLTEDVIHDINQGGREVGRAAFAAFIGFQDKLQMTRFENEQWGIQGGDTIEVFPTPFGKVGISVCYDSEFPLIARRQVELGADVILVPSCTDALAGYHRVKIGCQARALENQCYVVHACTVGVAEWSPAVDENCGAAAVYAPADYGFPADGVVVSGVLNESGWVYADLDTRHIATVRQSGKVFNYRDWDRQQTLVQRQ